MEKYRNLKRSLAFLLCAAMLVSYMPSPVFTLADESADTPEVAAGNADSESSETVKPSPKKSSDNTAVKEVASSAPDPVEKEEPVVVVEEKQREEEPPQNASGTDPPASENQDENDDQQADAQPVEEAENVQAVTGEPVLLAAGEEEEEEEQTYKLNFRDRDGKVISTRDVKKGDDFGSLPSTIAREDYHAYWAYGTFKADGQSGSWNASASDVVSSGETININRAKDGEINIVPYYEKVTHTVNFYAEDKTTLIASKTVDVDTSFCLNDIPAVPAKSGFTGKWVYDGGDFNNSVVNRTDRSVWVEYTQTVFTVEFVIPKGDDKVESYETDTYYSGDALTLPANPVVDGKDFTGWYVGEKQYMGGEEVTGNLTLTAHFADEYSVRFIVLADDGVTELETLSQYFRTSGEKIGTMPEDPFQAGKIFEKWVIRGTDTAVTKDTVVTENLVVVAQFRSISVYNITAKYFYLNDSGNKVVFNTDLYQAEAEELPYKIDVPATTQTDPDEVSGGPKYYASTPSVTVKKSDFDEDNKCTVEIEYVKYTAEYYIVHMLKDLDGEGYTEIERELIQGVKNSYVTPNAKTYDYAVLEKAEGAEITEASGQELPVYYTRKNFQLTFETNGGSYVAGGTYAYGSSVNLPAENPKRDGYDFAGWYSDEALTEPVSGSVTIEADTTLYAKWTGKTVNYTIVYMLEKYNNSTNTTSYVYDNSRNASGQVGTEVVATSAPDLTGNNYRGYEKDNAFNASSKVTIAADGSSVLVVHYKLIRYTLVFNINRNSGRITMGGQTYTGNNYRIANVVLGQDVSSMWPSDNANEIYDTATGWNRQYFEYWSGANGNYVTKRYELIYDNVSNANANHVQTYTAHWSDTDNSRSAEYWLQQPDGSYKREDAYNQFGLNTTNLGAKNIDGYTKHSGTPRGYSGSGNGTDAQGNYRYIYRFYYDRAQYDIEYYFGSTKLNTKADIYFEANINNAEYNYTPAKPASTGSIDYSDYTWGGWYEDSALQTKYNFDKMPGHNLALYAKWVAPEFKVNFVMDGGEPAAEDQTIAKYGRAEKPENPSKAGYNFEGWFTSADGDTLYDWNTQITADTTIYAHWSLKTLSYTVRYVDEAGNEVATPKTVTNPNYRVGDKVEEKAIAIAGFRPQTNSEELTLTGTDSDEIVFVYVQKSEFTSYKVRYILDPEEYPGDIEVAEEKLVENVPGDTTSVVEFAAAVDYNTLYKNHPELDGTEFHPDKVEKSLVLAANEADNVLTFVYSNYRNATVTVHYVDMAGNEIADTHTEHLKVGKTFTLSRTPISGWELNKAVEGNKYSDAAAGSSYKITEAISASGLEFTIFYQKKLTITANSFSKQYDGTALMQPESLNGKVIIDGLLAGDSVTNVGFDFANTDNNTKDGRINAGIAKVTPKDAQLTGTHANVENYYKIRYISGTLEVTKINVTIRVEPDRWTGNQYDGKVRQTGFTNGSKGITDYVMISHEGYSEKYLDEVWAAVNSAPVTGSNYSKVTHEDGAAGLGYVAIAESKAGDYTYKLSLTTADLPKDDNYSVSLMVRDGRLEILPKALTITAGSDTKAYDGTALTNDSFTSSDLAEGDKIDSVTVTGSQTEVGSSANVPSDAKIVNAKGEDVTASYIIEYKNGTLEVTKKAVTITADSGTKAYDGTALTKNSYTNTALAEGDKIDSVTVTGSQTTVGSSANVPSAAKIVNAKNEDVTKYYEITYANGTLEVTKKAVTITADSDSKVYDGTALTKDSYTNTALASRDSIDSVTVTGSQTAVGKSNNVPSAAVIKNANTGEDVTANYEITYANGTLEVTKKALTITADSDTKVYDGTALTKNSYTNTALAEGDSIDSVTVTGSQTVVGKSDNVPSAAKIVNADGEDVTANYEITYQNGTLEVTKNAALIITADSDTKVYDGTALTKNSYQVAGLAEGDRVASVTVTGSQTTVGSSENVPSNAKVVNAAGEDVTANYTITYANGTLEVTKKTLTITADSSTKVYDGTALTKNSFTNTALAEGDEIDSVTITGSQTTVGSSNNVPSAAKIVNAKGDDVTASYEITYANGTLEVTKKTLTITADSDTKVYDGTALTKNSFTNTALAEGDEIDSVTVTGSQTAVGSSENVPSAAKIVNAKGDDVTASYEITYANGTLEVTKKTLTITADNGTKVYDGTALTKNSFTNTALAEGDEIDSVTVTGSQTAVGSSDNVPSGAKIVNAKGADVTASYEITYANGTLEVTKKTLTITADSGNKVYDGTALTKDSFTNTELAKGDKIDSVTVTGSQTAVGSSANVASEAAIVNAKGEDVTGNYEISYENGTLEVTKKALTITADSDSKVYDGIALTKDSYTNTALAEGDELTSVTVTGSQTNVGKSDNVPSAAVIVNAAGEAATENYDITYKNGSLEVTAITDKVTVTITENSGSEKYDGEEKTVEGYTVSIDNELYTENDFEFSGNASVSGKNAGTYDMELKASDFANTNENFADVEFVIVDGQLKISKRSVTLTSADDQKVYDGAALTNDEVTVGGDGFADGEGAKFTVTGSQTLVGESANTFTYKLNAGTLEDNYTITKTEGTLKVTDGTEPDDPKPVPDDKVVTKSSEDGKTYHIGDTVTWTIWVKNIYDEEKKLTVNEKSDVDLSSYPATLKAGEEITITATHVITAADVANKGYKNEVTVKLGDLEKKGDDEVEAEPISITITAKSARKVYDGKPLTEKGYDLTGKLADNNKIASVTVTGEQTLVGKSNNVPSAAKIVDANGKDVTGGYAITYVNGTLTVTDGTNPGEDPVPDDKVVTKSSEDGKKYHVGDTVTWKIWVKNIYDEEKSLTVTEQEGVALSSYPKTLKAGEEVTITATHVITAADVAKGQYKNEVSAKLGDLEKKGDDTVDTEKIAITITAGSGSKVYDGTALRVNKYSLTAGTLASGNKIASVTVTGSRTAVGSSKNVPSNAKIVNANGEDVTAAYTITYVNGTLKITRAGGGGGNPPGPGPGPGPAPDGDPVVTPDDGTVVPDTPVPQTEPDEAEIPDNPTPLAAGAWALINLIAAILTTLGAIVALFRKKEKDDEEDEDQEGAKKAENEDEDEDDNRGKKMLAAKLAGAVAGIAAPIAFILTEDMSLPMQMIDKWTLLMVIILAVQVVAAILNKRASKLDDEEEEETPEAAH